MNNCDTVNVNLNATYKKLLKLRNKARKAMNKPENIRENKQELLTWQ